MKKVLVFVLVCIALLPCSCAKTPPSAPFLVAQNALIPHPHSDEILFLRKECKEYAFVCSVPLMGGAIHTVTKVDGDIGFVTPGHLSTSYWSSNGNSLLVSSVSPVENPSDPRSLLQIQGKLLHFDEYGHTTVSTFPFSSFLAWRPDGEQLLGYQFQGSEKQLALYDPTGVSIRVLDQCTIQLKVLLKQLLPSIGEDFADPSQVFWVGDIILMTFGNQDTVTTTPSASAGDYLVCISIANEKVSLLSDHIQGVVWPSPNGKYLLYRSLPVDLSQAAQASRQTLVISLETETEIPISGEPLFDEVTWGEDDQILYLLEPTGPVVSNWQREQADCQVIRFDLLTQQKEVLGSVQGVPSLTFAYAGTLYFVDQNETLMGFSVK